MADWDLLGVAFVIALLWVLCWGGLFCALLC